MSKLPQLPSRTAESHKGDYGRGLVVGGSRGMSGAVALAGVAALRSGAGLVQLAVPDVCQETVAQFEPSYTTVGLAADEGGRLASDAFDDLMLLTAQATAVGVGPGLGRSRQLDTLVGRLYCELAMPAVFDADGLNALAKGPDMLASAGGPRIITPHPGEFARLVGAKTASVKARRSQAVELAAGRGIVVVLKGHETLVTDGVTSTLNETGNPGMATGGSGDVLTGVITALLCQGLAPLDAARLGVHVHGLAGDLAAEDVGQVSLMASDLLEYLPAAFQELAMDD